MRKKYEPKQNVIEKKTVQLNNKKSAAVRKNTAVVEEKHGGG